MLRPDGTLKVLDFGIVALLDPAMEDTKITEAGFYSGAPPTWRRNTSRQGDQPEHRSLCRRLHLPQTVVRREGIFPAPPGAMAAMHMKYEPPKLDTLGVVVPEEIQSLISSLLEKVPENRPQSAAEVYEFLMPFVADLPPMPGATAPPQRPSPRRCARTLPTGSPRPPSSPRRSPWRPTRRVLPARSGSSGTTSQPHERKPKNLPTTVCTPKPSNCCARKLRPPTRRSGQVTRSS